MVERKKRLYLTQEQRDGQPNAPSVDDFALRINACWRKAVESIIETGKELIQARAQLAYGEWGKLFRDPKKVPFSQRTADYLMRIANHSVLSNSQYVANLPASWSTLSHIADLPGEAIVGLIADGSITPDTQAADVKEIAKRLEDEAIYNWKKFRETFQVQLRFMRKWPTGYVVGKLFGEVGDGDRDRALGDNELAELLPWFAEIDATHKREEAEYEAREKEREEQREASEEGRGRSRRAKAATKAAAVRLGNLNQASSEEYRQGPMAFFEDEAEEEQRLIDEAAPA